MYNNLYHIMIHMASKGKNFTGIPHKNTLKKHQLPSNTENDKTDAVENWSSKSILSKLPPKAQAFISAIAITILASCGQESSNPAEQNSAMWAKVSEVWSKIEEREAKITELENELKIERQGLAVDRQNYIMLEQQAKNMSNVYNYPPTATGNQTEAKTEQLKKQWDTYATSTDSISTRSAEASTNREHQDPSRKYQTSSSSKTNWSQNSLTTEVTIERR